MTALVRTFRVKGFNDPKTPVSVFSFQYQEEGLVVRMFRSDGGWMPAFAYLIGQPRKEFYRGSGLDQTFFVTVQKENSTQVGHVLEYTTSAGEHTVDLELVDAIDDEWPLAETPLVPQGEDPAFPNTKIPRRQFHPVELSVTVGGLEPEGPATFYSQDLKGYPAGRNYTIFNEGRWDHFHEPHESIVWVRASKGGKDFAGTLVLPAGSSRVALDFDPETGDMTADVELFPPSQSPLQELGGPIRRVAPGFKAPMVYTLEVQITKEGVPTPSAMKSMYVYRSQQDTTPSAIYQILNGFNEKQTFSEDITGDWFVQAMDEEPPRIGSLRWPSITEQDTVLRFDLSESQQVRPDPGIGILSGSFPLSLLTDKDSAPSRAVVRVLYRTEEGHPGDGVLITTTTCNADGTWQVAGLNENEKFDVVARIPGFNDVIISDVQPTGAPLSAHFANLKEEYKYQEEVNIQVVALGGRPPYAYEAITLPDGLSLSPDGYITGTMLGSLELTFEVKITDAEETVFNLVGSSYVPGDPYWDQVVLLVQTPYNGNLPVDLKGRHTISVDRGTPAVSMEYPLFDQPSMEFTGSTVFSIPDSVDWAFGAEDFTVEMWFLQNSTPRVYEGLISHVGTTYVQNGWKIITLNNASGTVVGQLSTTGTANTHSLNSASFPQFAWQHVAFVRVGGTLKFFTQGVLSAEASIGTASVFDSDRPLLIGEQNGSRFSGFIGPIRITKGVARYTENFDPPTEPFPTFGPEPDLPTVIGEPYGGGFYAGDIESDGQWYKLIVADIEADVYGLPWMTPRADWPQAVSNTDGSSNTLSMAGDARFEAGNHCLNWRGGGFDDWYMPALLELLAIYENLGHDKTPPAGFESGGAQAFHASDYWCSTQRSATHAWYRRFSNGHEGNDYKNEPFRRVRPVRRIPFTP